MARFGELNEENRRANLKTVYLNAAYFPGVELLSALASAGILLSVPGLLAQYANLASYGRGRAAPVLQDTVDVPTLLRFFSRDIFGHSWRDQLQLPAADQLNFHEGDLLHSSVFGALLLALIILSFHWLSKRDTRAPSSLRYYSLVFVPYILFVFAVMHVPRVYLLFARLYLNVSFQHSRVAVSAMLPVAILVALFIAQYRGPLTRRHVPIVALVSLVVVSVSAVSVPRLLDRVAPSRPLYVSCNSCLSLLHFTHLFTSDLVRLLGLSVAFALIVGAGFASGSAGRRIMATVLAVGITFQTIWGAADYLEGPQTRDYTIPWENNDFVVAPPDQFLPPTPNEMEQLHMLLDNNDFRSITLCPSHYPNCSTTIGMTWGVRLADGYTSGVPHRLAVLPSLPAELHNLRWDSAAAVGRAWRTLAFLNVRQALTIDRKFYMNMRLRVPDDIVIVRNPSSFVYPRAYFARTIQAVDAMGDEAAVVQELDACQSDCQGLQERFATDFVEGGVSGSYDDSGDLHWSGGGDRLSFDFPASDQPRFLVVNDMWDHGWSAVAGNQPVPVWPTNVAMRGIPIPPGASHLELVYHSFLWWLWWYLPATIALNMLAVVVVRRRLGARA
ncbi:MAG: hypothetical protein JO023_28850 [Chloroflexi bacterium]|nr:hypothetical protein [Chloroflexota bacterium]